MRTQTLLIVIVGLALCAIALNARADDYYIDPVNGSDETGDGSQGSPWKTLNYANEQTKCQGTEENPVVLHALAGVYSPSTNGETFPLTLGDPNQDPSYEYCSLVGAGAEITIIDAEATGRVIKVFPYNGTLSDLTITGGGHPDPEYRWAGGIRATPRRGPSGVGSFTLQRCIISENGQGSGVEVGDNAIVTIRRCTITGNWKKDGKGAGVDIGPSSWARVLIQNCEVSDNRMIAPNGNTGGGIHVSNCTGTIENCTVIGNSALEQAGGISLLSGSMIVQNCLVANNSAEKGAGIYPHWNTRSTIQNCLITGNTATTGEGGGIFVANIMHPDMHSEADVINCTIADNEGCGVFLEDREGEKSKARLYNCVIWGQTESVVGVPCSTIHHCNISDGDGLGSDGNISQDPLFVTGAQGDYYLSHADVNQLRIGDCGLRNVSDADANSNKKEEKSK